MLLLVLVGVVEMLIVKREEMIVVNFMVGKVNEGFCKREV